MKWMSSFSTRSKTAAAESMPTSSSLIALFLVFVVVWLYLSWKKPDFVMEKEELSYRRVFVYALLCASSVALVVFGYVYWKHRKTRQSSKASKASKASKESSVSREGSKASKESSVSREGSKASKASNV